jgi:TonB family protein
MDRMAGWIGAGLSAIAAAMLQPGAAGAPERPRAWQVDWGEQFCTLVRLSEPATPFVTGFRIIPGTDHPSIVMARSGSEPLPAGINAIVLAPSGRTFPVTARIERRALDQNVLVLNGLDETFWNALGGAGELQLKAGNRIRRRIALPQAAPAVAALRQCTSQVMREWGIDEAALGALRERPTTTNMLGVRDTDYPGEALRSSTQGRVVVRIDVGTDGRATECVPVGPSGSAALDAATCRVVMTRAHFRPAIGADGLPTAARMIHAVAWLVDYPL